MQFVAGIPLAVKVGLAEGWLGYLVGFIGAVPIAIVAALVAAKGRTHGPMTPRPMTLARGLTLAFVTFFMLVGMATVTKILYDMFGQ